MLRLDELVTINGSYRNVYIPYCKDVNDLVYKIGKNIIIEFSYSETNIDPMGEDIMVGHNYVIPQYIVSFKV